MFGLIRLVAFAGIAFVAGVFFERANQSDACLDAGGQMQAGLCVGAQP